MKPLCIYHGNCADGFTAAWVVRKAFGGEIDFYPGVYQNLPPDVAGRDVILVDFSYKRDVLMTMARTAHTITILDHHKTAAEDLHVFCQSNYPQRRDEMSMSCHEFRTYCDFHGMTPIRAVFDMNRSGARIAWDHFFPGLEPPLMLRHVEDRDLGRFAIQFTREVQANVFSYPYDFGLWDTLMMVGEDRDKYLRFKREGEAILRKHFKDIDELLGVVTRRMRIGGHVVPIANLPYTLVTDAGGKLAEGMPFAGCYWDTRDGRVFSLRSTPDGLDVSDVAKQYGGGGHARAAGFRVSYEEAKAFEVEPVAA